MAIVDDALFTAAKGYIYVAPVGTAAPSPSTIDTFNPATTGCEVQTITITGTPTSGSFTLTFDGQTTANIAHNASAADVKSALELLSNIGAGNVSTSGGPLPGSPVLVTFTGELASTNVALMTSTDSFSGGSEPESVVTTSTAPWAWTNLGHTSREDLPEFGFDGGDSETKGTWQNSSVKTVITSQVVDSVTFKLHQFDEAALELYYGQSNSSVTPGQFSIDDAATAPIEKALMIIIVDGDAVIACHAHKTSILRDDAVAIAVDEFSSLPLKATFLKNGTSPLFSWISLDMPVNPA